MLVSEYLTYASCFDKMRPGEAIKMDKDNEVTRLQKNLSLFRACAGWTAKDLADQLDVSRQTISAWENYYSSQKEKGAKLSKGYYLAIRQLLETAVKTDVSDEKELKKKHILGTMLEVLVDNPEAYTDDDKHAILAEADLMAPSIMKQPEKRKTISKIWPGLLVGAGVVLSVALKAILDQDDK